jgi:hypothetical protein
VAQAEPAAGAASITMAELPDPDWATVHCTEPAAELVLKATGRDIWAELGGCPHSWREAAEIYRRLGVTNLKDAVSAILGPPVDLGHARRGDIAMVDGALGIVRGELVECLDRMQPIGRAACAWRIK